MSNVTNKIIFAKDKAEKIFSATCPEGMFSFATLIPSPYPHYADMVESEGEMSKWVQWNIQHWGTKHPAFEQAVGIQGNDAYIVFKTKHNVAYPVMNVFARKFQVPFEHHYIHDQFLFWGIEKWGTTPATGAHLWRLEISRDLPDHRKALCVDLLGYEPLDEEEDKRI